MRRKRLAVERLEERIALAVDFNLLALVYPEIDDDGARVRFDAETLDAVVYGVQVELPSLIQQLAGDQIQARVHVEVVNRVIQARDDHLVHDHLVEPDLVRFTKSGWYDHVLVIHGHINNAFGGACCAFPRPKMTMSTIGLSTDSKTLHAGDVPGMLHEWMHALDWVYFVDNNVPSGNDPDGNPLRLHSGGSFGYQSSTEDRPAWTEWYGDYLTGHIRDFNINGIDTGKGLGADAWVHGAPRHDVSLASGSPLERPEPWHARVSLLSDVYWASASTQWGQVRRNATVDNNPIRINGKAYDNGVGIHAHGEIVVNLRGRIARFQADIGVDDDTPPTAGSIRFKVYGDGRLLYSSGVMTGADAAVSIDVDTFAVSQLRLVVEDAGDWITSDHAVWADARLLRLEQVFASDVAWGATDSGWGEIHLDKTINRGPIDIGGRRFGKGISTHADSAIVIPLDRKYTAFSSFVGIPDYVSANGTVTFQAFVDGSLAYTSGNVTPSDSAKFFEIDVTNVRELRLVVNDSGNGNHSDHAVWSGAILTDFNDPPTLNVIRDPSPISEDASIQSVAITGVSAGGGEDQALTVTATSNNFALIPHPNVSYTSPNATGLLSYRPEPDQSGAATITVSVTDAGLDGIAGNGDDATSSRTFRVVVNAVNDSPTIDNFGERPAIDEDASKQVVQLTGISAGGGEVQAIAVSTFSSNTALIPHPTVSYTSANTFGSISYTPVADQSGEATVTVEVTDGGLDGVLGNGDDAKTTRTFRVAVIPTNDPPTIDAIDDPAPVDEDAPQQTVNLAGVSAGGGESQLLRVTAESDNTALIPHPSISYTSPNSTGSLNYTPQPGKSGVATITVRVSDAGFDGVEGNWDDGETTRTFQVEIKVSDYPWNNTRDRFDVNADLLVNLVDAFQLLDELRIRGAGANLSADGPGPNGPFVDLNRNNRIDLVDAFTIIQKMRDIRNGNGESEGELLRDVADASEKESDEWPLLHTRFWGFVDEEILDLLARTR